MLHWTLQTLGLDLTAESWSWVLLLTWSPNFGHGSNFSSIGLDLALDRPSFGLEIVITQNLNLNVFLTNFRISVGLYSSQTWFWIVHKSLKSSSLLLKVLVLQSQFQETVLLYPSTPQSLRLVVVSSRQGIGLNLVLNTSKFWLLKTVSVLTSQSLGLYLVLPPEGGKWVFYMPFDLIIHLKNAKIMLKMCTFTSCWLSLPS